MTHYHFLEATYRSFADLANAYQRAKGYWPCGAKRQTLEIDGWHLYY